MLRALFVALALAACGSQNGSGPVAPTVKVATLPDGPPLVTPGERMTYRLKLQGLELAAYDLGIGELAEIAGRQTILVQAHARTVGLANAIAKVDDYFSSWIDVTNGRPLRWIADEYSKGETDKERTVAELHARAGDSVPITFALGAATPAPEPQKVSMTDVWDYNAFLIAVRSWEGAAGSSVAAEVLRSRWMWHVDIKIGGKSKLDTELGELPALRFDAHTYKLDRNGAKYPNSDERDFSIWISDDDGRVPLQIVARTDYGDIKMEIVSYEPGNGKRLRN